MSDQMTLNIEPLTAESFAPFGEVIQTESAHSFLINNGTTERFHALAAVELLEENSDVTRENHCRAIISIFRAEARHFPFSVSMLEKHPLGSQAFIPLSGEPYLVVVATGMDSPGQLRAFIATATQGVNYRAGVWHHPLLALHKTCDFLVVDRQGSGVNCIEDDLDPPYLLIYP
ncbi:ureidoglycolate lyase [Aquirhabdus parva]|nr:ureidoglycolate lyase [Aquirhabdus parva]